MPEIKFEIAGEVLSLSFPYTRSFSPFIRRHGDFLTEKKASFFIRFHQDKKYNDLFSVSIKQKGDEKIIQVRNRPRLMRSFHTGHLEIGMRQPIGLENYLRIFLSHYLFRKGGFLLHASTVGHKNKAYIFTGPSGVGKSTVARISQDKLVLSDDLVAVKQDGKSYRVFSTPFGVQKRNIGSVHLPIAAIYLLSHAKKTTCIKLPLKQALAKVMSNIVLIGADSLDLPVDRLFDNCYNILKSTPCYELAFNKNEDIWRYLLNAG